jgi:hypothetical protein
LPVSHNLLKINCYTTIQAATPLSDAFGLVVCVETPRWIYTARGNEAMSVPGAKEPPRFYAAAARGETELCCNEGRDAR